MRVYGKACYWLARAMLLFSLIALAVIVVALSLQVGSRYFLGFSVGHTDEIAQSALVWMTFLGAAFLYRERGHIEVDLLVRKFPPRVACIIRVLTEIAILSCLLLIVDQIFDLSNLMRRSLYGNLQISRFTLHYLPLLIGCMSMILFAIEAIIKYVRGIFSEREAMEACDVGMQHELGGL
jgi:TRAP-type transport system small permease protein